MYVFVCVCCVELLGLLRLLHEWPSAGLINFISYCLKIALHNVGSHVSDALVFLYLTVIETNCIFWF